MFGTHCIENRKTRGFGTTRVVIIYINVKTVSRIHGVEYKGQNRYLLLINKILQNDLYFSPSGVTPRR